MPSLIPLLLVHHDLPAPVLASLRIVADSHDPHARAHARRVASAGLQAAYNLSETEVADLIADQAPAACGGTVGSPSPRRTSPSRARAQNT